MGRIACRPSKRVCTAQMLRRAVACVPGVKPELAAKLLSHFGSFGGVVIASEGDMMKVSRLISLPVILPLSADGGVASQVVGVSRAQAERMVRFFGCRRGHSVYSEASWKPSQAGPGAKGPMCAYLQR